ncbi:unnamed protein product [Schistosoma margrebowiei]|uniref:Uncharacterized protein n=1 Tax=Schistosoma margrebowiei TaxID=48269 RepID=A0A183LN41_9TREM|nr:unnamed protein product [Schistosoma margrebowiei]
MAAREGNMKQLYDATKKLSENRCKPERPVKSKEGEVITNIEEQRNRWVEHFKELLNRPAPLNPPNIEAAPTDIPINVDPPTIKEISMAIRQIKSGKAAGPNNIPAEALKADLSTQSTSDPLSGHHQQQLTIGENKSDPSGGRNQEKVLEVDRTHIEESTQLRHKTSPHMESSRPKEERKIKGHITPGNGDRHEKNEQELDETRKEGLGQSGLENAGWQPMLH